LNGKAEKPATEDLQRRESGDTLTASPDSTVGESVLASALRARWKGVAGKIEIRLAFIEGV
jgi:hypothetical protein